MDGALHCVNAPYFRKIYTTPDARQRLKSLANSESPRSED